MTTRIAELPSWPLLEALTRARLQASMPVGLPLGFRVDALYDGEIGKLLQAMTGMVMPELYGIHNLSRQLTLTDAQEDYIDVVAKSHGLPPRQSTEDPDHYVDRIAERLLTKGRTMANIQANLVKLGFAAKLYPMAERLFVPSTVGRSPSSGHAYMPNAATKAGVYVVELWGPTMSNWGVHELLEAQTAGSYDYLLRHHIHWGVYDTCNGTATDRVRARVKRQRHQLLCYTDVQSLVPSAPWASPGAASASPGGINRTWLIKRKRKQYRAAEVSVLAFAQLPLAQQVNLFVQLDHADPWAAPGQLRYTVVSEPLTVASTRSCLQAGVRVTKRS